jgi:tetratricopeptide (TPR) repeat protein
VTAKDPLQMRLELARMHWALGEHGDALAALERCAGLDPAHDALLQLVDGCLEELEAGHAVDVASRLARLRAKLIEAHDAKQQEELPAKLATPTLARLLAEQGHAQKALAVADDLVRRNPKDERALAVRASLTRTPEPPARHGRVIAELERWLARLTARKTERKHGGVLA